MKEKQSKTRGFFQNCRGFVLGVIVTALTMGLALTALASPEIADLRVAVGGIKIYIDGDLQTPRNVNGDVVEPFVYDGTTYLPVRALTNMLTDKAVNWDQETYSIYIGNKPGKPNVGIEKLTGTNGNIIGADTGNRAKFKVLGKEYAPNNRAATGTWTYLLSSEYKEIHGQFVPYGFDLGSTGMAYLRFYNVDSYGTETLLKEYTAKAGDDPIDVSVNLSGVNYLRTKISDTIGGAGDHAAFYNVYLTPAF